MSEIAREEIDVKINLSNARTDTKFEILRAEMREGFQAIHKDFTLLAEQQSSLRNDFRDMRAEIRGMKSLILVTVIASVLASIGLVFGVQANMLSAFQASLTVTTAKGPTP